MSYSITEQFTDLVHRSVSDPINRAIQADALATEIGYRSTRINESSYGHLFATLQVVLADEFVLSLTRMYDKPNPSHPTQSIPAVIQFMLDEAKGLTIVDRAPLERMLAASGRDKVEVQQLGDEELTKVAAHHCHTDLPRPEKGEKEPLSASLRALRFRRNKQIAHAQKVEPQDKLPVEWQDGRALLSWALEFGDLVGVAYMGHYFLASDGVSYLGARFSREAAEDLGRLLDEVNLVRGQVPGGVA